MWKIGASRKNKQKDFFLRGGIFLSLKYLSELVWFIQMQFQVLLFYIVVLKNIEA